MERIVSEWKRLGKMEVQTQYLSAYSMINVFRDILEIISVDPLDQFYPSAIKNKSRETEFSKND